MRGAFLFARCDISCNAVQTNIMRAFYATSDTRNMMIAKKVADNVYGNIVSSEWGNSPTYCH